MDSFFLVASKRVQILGVSCHTGTAERTTKITWPNLGGAFRPPGKEGRCTNDRFPSTGCRPRRCRSIPKKSGHRSRADRPEGAPSHSRVDPARRWACSSRPPRDAATARSSSAAPAGVAGRRPPPRVVVSSAARKRRRRPRRRLLLPRPIARRRGGGSGGSGGRRRPRMRSPTS